MTSTGLLFLDLSSQPNRYAEPLLFGTAARLRLSNWYR